jgi:uncharacterized protein (TIGR02722 family)
MKKTAILLSCLAAIVAMSCATTGVSRVDPNTVTDLSGYWNDTDVRIVCEKITSDCLASPGLANFATKKGRLPVVIVGSFRNQSDEHIDTSIITKKLETALINSGKAEFVADKNERADIREERTDQQSWASEATAKAIADETGADYMLLGSVKTIVDRAGGTSARVYYIDYELIDLQSNKKVFVGENNDIKKVITRPKNKF